MFKIRVFLAIISVHSHCLICSKPRQLKHGPRRRLFETVNQLIGHKSGQ